jgi:CRP/FNR family transcriptional regulator
MMGDLLGLDAIGGNRHVSDAVALEDSEVCEISFPLLEQISRDAPCLQQQLNRVMSREIIRDQGVMLLLGSMRADERLAAFLLNLSQRFAVRGYSATEFNLRMTRQEIGSYLGLKLETVSRAFSGFHRRRLIEVRQRNVRIIDLARLRAMLGPSRRPDRRPA